MFNRYLTRKMITVVFVLSVILNLLRFISKLRNNIQVDIDVMFIILMVIMYIQYIRLEDKLLFVAFLFITYASIVMFFNYYLKFSDILNLILFIPLLLGALYFFYKLMKKLFFLFTQSK